MLISKKKKNVVYIWKLSFSLESEWDPDDTTAKASVSHLTRTDSTPNNKVPKRSTRRNSKSFQNLSCPARNP